MNLSRRRFSSSSSIGAALLAAAALTVTGCGFDSTQSGPSAGSATISGIVHGGPNPVIGATVKLYATASNGYGGAGTLLGTATTTTNSNGGFTFSLTYPLSNCTGQQAYITAASGNTGSNSTNNSSLLMAAIGPCSSLSSSTVIIINEESTIAAAYALSNFITISGTGSSMVVGVSAPAKNNATSGSCTGTGSSMSCSAAGLAHAFLNAANLVNAAGTTSAPPTGLAYASPASDPTTSALGVALQNVVPAQEINSLADSIEACVNSSGGSTACTTLFSDTTVSSNYTSNATYTTAPTNTLQALVNLAKFPFTSVSGIYGIGSGNSYYQPTLTAAPPDWSISIIWRSYGVNEIGTVYYTTTDINDNVYATALTAPTTGSIIGALPYIAHSLSSDGVGNWTAPATLLSSSGTTYTCDANAGTAATSGACFAAPDTAGHLWVGMGANSLSAGGLWQVGTSGGAVTQFTAVNGTSNYPFALAVDADNDLFYTGTQNGANNLFEIPSGSAASTTPTAVLNNGSAYQGAHLSDSLVFDTSGNIWAPDASGSNVGYGYIQNTGTLAAEAFATSANNCNCLGTATVGLDKWPTGGMVDSSGNYWMTGQNGVVKIVQADAQSVSGGGSTGVTEIAVGVSATTMRISSMDGAGTIFVPDNNTSGEVNEQSGPPAATAPSLIIFYPGFPTQTTVAIQGCNVGTATGNTTCITGAQTAPNSGLFYQAVNPAIDSTGSIWVSSEGNDAIVQVIGTAAPTWPQASYLHPGVMPQ
jgi:hypothetical protein